MTDVSCDGSTVSVDGLSVHMDYPVREAFEVDGVNVVLLDPDADLGKQGQYRNLIGIRPDGTTLWRANLPTDRRSDAYCRIASRAPLVVSSFSSYDCEIDVRTGRVIRADFYK